MRKRILAVFQSAVLALTAAAGQFALPARAADDKDGPQLTECELRITPDGGPAYPTSPSRSAKSTRKASSKGDSPQITVQGMLPEDVCAAAVTVDPDVYIEPTKDAILYAYDISLYSQDMVYEPENEAILVSVSGRAIRNAIDEGTKLTVVHIPDDPSEPVAYIQDLSLSGDTLSFTTDSFSVYLIKEGDDGVVQTNRHVYHYLTGDKNDAGEITNTPYEFPAVNESGIVTNVSSQIVRDGNYLNEPTVPEQQNGKSFLGWYIVGEVRGGDAAAGASFEWPDGDTIDSRRVNFGEPVSVPEGTENDNVHYYLAPLYRNYRIVVFHEHLASGQDMVYSKKMVVLGTTADNTMRGTVRLDDVKAPDHGSDMFYGWKLENTNSYVDNFYTTRDSAGNYHETYLEVTETAFPLNLYWDESIYIKMIPMHKTGHWLIFDSGHSDATYFSPAYIESDAYVDSALMTMRVPVWPGYTFLGWYLDQAGTDQLTDSSGNVIKSGGQYRIDRDTTVYAKWDYTGGNAQYKYLYWEQLTTDSADDINNYDNKHYSFLRSVTAEGPAGPGTLTAVPNVEPRTGFTVRVDEPKEVNPDGSTVINIYYDREVRTIDFMLYTDSYNPTTSNNNNTQYYGLVDGEYIPLTKQGNNYYYSEYHFTASSRTGEGDYWIPNGDGTYTQIHLYYNNGRYYRNRSGWLIYSYSNQYTGTRYDRTEETAQYTGTRYTRGSSWMTYKTIYGLFEQTFSQAAEAEGKDVSWPTEYDWYESYSGGSGSGIRVTFLDGFTADAKSAYYSKTRGSTTGSIVFLKQGLNENEWVTDMTVSSNGGSSTFTFTEKYQGFSVQEYSTDGGATWHAAVVNPDADNGKATYTDTLMIRFRRKSYQLRFLDGTDDPTNPKSTYTVKFGADLTEYADEELPSPLGDYKFNGWSPKLEGKTMPAYDLTVYAERETLVVQVILEMEGGAFKEDLYNGVDINDPNWTNPNSTYFKLRYPNYKVEEYQPEFAYTPDPNGQYVYILVEPEKDADGKYITPCEPPVDPDTGAEMHRFARYVRRDSAVAAQYADYLKKDDGGNVQYYRSMNSSTDGRNTLVGWYEVDPETGELINEHVPFNFRTDVKKELIILRAVWMNTGAQFSVTYEAVTELDGITVAGELTGANEPVMAENAFFNVAEKPKNITSNDPDPHNEYVFEYWEVAGIRVMPGDQMKATRAIADSNLNITIRAVYAKREESIHNQQLMHLRLHANYIAEGASVEETYMGEELQNMQQNHRVDLADYETAFTRDHFRLVGWSTKPNADDPDAVVFPLNAQVGAYLDQPGVPGDAESFTSHLYAVWEQIPPAPTGVHDSRAPYLLMVMIAAMLMAAVIYRRKEGMHDDSPPL